MDRWDCLGFVQFKFVTSLVEMYESLNYIMQGFYFFFIYLIFTNFLYSVSPKCLAFSFLFSSTLELLVFLSNDLTFSSSALLYASI